MDTKYLGQVRHAIEFYGLNPVIPNSLRNFKGFIYNKDKGRISFIVAPGTSYKTLFKIYSTDPKIQDFNRIFTNANKNLDWKKIKSYDFADNTGTTSQNQIPQYNPVPNINPTPSPSPTPNNYPPAPTDDPTKKDDSMMIYYLVGVGVVAYLVMKKKKKRR